MSFRSASDVEREVPVLFAGGGLVGLSTAMFLAQHGIASLAVERLRGGSPGAARSVLSYADARNVPLGGH